MLSEEHSSEDDNPDSNAVKLPDEEDGTSEKEDVEDSVSVEAETFSPLTPPQPCSKRLILCSILFDCIE